MKFLLTSFFDLRFQCFDDITVENANNNGEDGVTQRLQCRLSVVETDREGFGHRLKSTRAESSTYAQ